MLRPPNFSQIKSAETFDSVNKEFETQGMRTEKITQKGATEKKKVEERTENKKKGGTQREFKQTELPKMKSLSKGGGGKEDESDEEKKRKRGKRCNTDQVKSNQVKLRGEPGSGYVAGCRRRLYVSAIGLCAKCSPPVCSFFHHLNTTLSHPGQQAALEAAMRTSHIYV